MVKPADNRDLVDAIRAVLRLDPIYGETITIRGVRKPRVDATDEERFYAPHAWPKSPKDARF